MRGVEPGRVRANTGERASVVPRAGCERVKNLAQAVRAAVVQGDEAPFAHDRPRGERENIDGQNEQRQHRHLHVVGLDFFAEIFRRASDHQAGDEDGEHDKDEHPVKSGADTAEDDFA